MGKVAFNQTWNGESNQAPFRTQPGQCRTAYNMRLDLAQGAVTRNGAELVATLSGTFNSNNGNLYWTTFRDDLVCIQHGSLQSWNILTGSSRIVNDIVGNTFAYLQDSASLAANTFRDSIDTTTIRDSLIVLNKSIATAIGSSSTYTVNGTVTDYSVLPTAATNGQIYLCRLPYGAVPAGYYKLNRPAGTPANTAFDWRRIAAPNQSNATPTPSTMPHALTLNSTSNYDWDDIPWTSRLSGSATQNPEMGWFGSAIDSICAHSGRLFLLAKGIITSTSSKDKYSLFIDDIDRASDVSNPVNEDLSNSSLGEALYSSSVNAQLFIAYEKGQVVFTSQQEQLTNVNGVDIQITDYRTKKVMPAFTGVTAVIADNNGDVREYAAGAAGYGLAYAGVLNAHANRILDGKEVLKIVRFDLTTFFLCSDGTVLCHEKALDAGDLVQTGWSRMNFGGTVLHMSRHGDALYLVVRNSDNSISLLKYIHHWKGAPTSFDYFPCLDYQQTVLPVYIPSEDRTRFTVSFTPTSSTVALTADTNKVLTPVVVGPNYIDVKGYVDPANGNCRVGNPVDSYMELMEFYAGASTAMPTISEMTVFYKDTASFYVTISRKGTGDSAEEERINFSTNILGQDLLSDNAVGTGSETFPVMLDGREAIIKIGSQTACPLTIAALEFSLRFSARGER